MRVLITGSRDWEDEDQVFNILTALGLGEGDTLVSGACPTGADKMCEDVAEFLGADVERHPAQWNTYGKSAGFRRNQEMVDMGADVCVAFIRNGSNGASMTANAAEQAEITTLRILA